MDHLHAFTTTPSHIPAFQTLWLQTQHAFKAEVESIEGLTALDFLPAPSHWKQIPKLPEQQRRLWLQALRSELQMLIKDTKTFEIIT